MSKQSVYFISLVPPSLNLLKGLTYLNANLHLWEFSDRLKIPKLSGYTAPHRAWVTFYGALRMKEIPTT